MNSRFGYKLRRPLLAAAAGALVFGSATALAGSGVGDVFNLGQTNTVGATSTLSGETAAPQLTVKNTSTNASATSLSLSVAAGRTPFKVNSPVKVANLNADLLDGRDSSYFLAKTAKAADADKLDAIDSTGFWKLGGNSVASPGSLGTTTNQALELKVNGQRALRIEPTADTPNVIGGSSANFVAPGIGGATIGGGGVVGAPNAVTGGVGTVAGGWNNSAGGSATVAGGQGNAANGNYSAIGGGFSNQANGTNSAVVAGGHTNQASGDYSAVGGGQDNTATQSSSTVAGGANNDATGSASFVGGGGVNEASGPNSVVGGGGSNWAAGSTSTVPGGYRNTASGKNSFAAGTRAQAAQDGSFVWNDSTFSDLVAPAANTFIVHSANGIWFGRTAFAVPSIPAGHFIETDTGAYLSTTGVWTSVSDRAKKHEFRPLDKRSVLEKVAGMPIASWSYKAEHPSVRHIGPTAQDFHAAFGLGLDDKHIATLDESGVALAAIQGLYGQNLGLQRQNDRLSRAHRGQTAQLARVERQNRELSARLTGLERRLGQLEAEREPRGLNERSKG